MTKPSLGRIVLVNERGQLEPAVVTTVHSETCINVRILGDASPNTDVRTSLTLRDYDSLEGGGGWCFPPRV